MCDHAVAFREDLIVRNKIAEYVKNECYTWNRYSDLMIDATGDTKRYNANRKPKEFLDRRRGYMTMFNHCPYCGEKINWREIKKTI